MDDVDQEVVDNDDQASVDDERDELDNLSDPDDMDDVLDHEADQVFDKTAITTLFKQHHVLNKSKSSQQWIDLALSVLCNYPADEAIFKTKEICHYLKAEHVQHMIIPWNADKEQLESLLTHFVPPPGPYDHLIQTPAQTMGKVVELDMCPKCKQKTVSFKTIQNRSSDEPSLYEHECGNCHFMWRSK